MIDTPLTLPCGARISNRIAKAAMTEGLADPSGRPSEALNQLYGLWSDGGAGLLLSGNVQIDALHLERPGNVVVEGEPSALMQAGVGGLGRRRHACRQSLLGTNQSRRKTMSKDR